MLDVVEDEPEAEEREKLRQSALGVGSSNKPISLKNTTSPATSSSSGLSSACLAENLTSSSSSLSNEQTSSPAMLAKAPKNQLSNLNQRLDVTVDSGKCSTGDSSTDADEEGEEEEEEEEQHTLVSPVTRRLNYLNSELGPEKNTLESRNNLMKAGSILAELKAFADDDDEIDFSQLSDDAANSVPQNINESELVLKPKLVNISQVEGQVSES